MIGIIGAMQIEVDYLLEEMQDKSSKMISGIKYVSGTLKSKEVVVAKCGIGKVFAALCTQTMILEYKPEIIINTGVSAGIFGETKIGDVIIGKTVVQYDMDTSFLGDRVGMISGIDLVHIPCGKKTAARLDEVMKHMNVNHKLGTIATGDKFISDSNEIKRINHLFGAIAFDMESAAVGQVCYVNGIEYGIIRSISDNGNEDAGMDFMQFAKRAAKTSAEAVKKFVEGIN